MLGGRSGGSSMRFDLRKRLTGLVLVTATAMAVAAPASPARSDTTSARQQWQVFQADCNGVDMGVKPVVGAGPFRPYFFSGHRIFIPYQVQYHFFGDLGGLKTRHGISNGEAVARPGPVPKHLQLCEFVGAVIQDGQLWEFTSNEWGVILGPHRTRLATR